MRVLQVNNVDLPGRRFNGYDLLTDLTDRGIDGTQVVLTKLGDDPRVVSLFDGEDDENLNNAIWRVENRHGMGGLLYPWGNVLLRRPEFESADAVHYHLIHNNMLSLLHLPELFAARPAVWTFHDPWPLTGHCIHPEQCDGWLTGCAVCPHLDRPFAMTRDCAAQMWRVKQRVLSQLDVDVVVASEFMLDMVRRSPLTSHLERVHLVPFGINADLFLPDPEKARSREMLGVPADDFVIFFRSTSIPLKGVDLLAEALALRPPGRPVTLLTVDHTGRLDALANDYNIVDLGWVEDESLYPRVFSACDVFVMPSLAESFGLMALEAMAAGRPVVCFADTAVESVTHAPECGVAVPLGDVRALRDAIDALAEDPAEVARRGALGRDLARDVYRYDRYLDALATLYRDIAAKGKAGAQ